MTGSRFRTVLLYDAMGDPVAAAAVHQLQWMAYAGLTDPVWTVDIGSGTARQWRIQETSQAGVVERESLLDTLAGTGPAELAQVVTIATGAACNEEVVRTLAGDARETVKALREFRPQGSRVIDARLIAPVSLEEPTFLVALLTPHADANLIAIPEDRESDEHFGAPVSGAHPEQFAGHVAAEVASQTGLWTGMGETPLEATSAGTIGNRDVKVNLVRSYCRVLLGPPVPLQSAVSELSPLPVPSGRELALDPDRDVSVAAFRLVKATTGMSHDRPPPYASPVRFVGTWNAFKHYLHEMSIYLRTVPQQLRAGVAADLDSVAAEAFTAVAGADSSIQIGRDPDGSIGLDRTIDRLVRTVEYEVDRLVSIPDPSPIAPDAWPFIVDALLAVADGSRLARGAWLPRNHGRQAVVTQVEYLAPELDADPGRVAQALATYESTGRHALAWFADTDDSFELEDDYYDETGLDDTDSGSTTSGEDPGEQPDPGDQASVEDKDDEGENEEGNDVVAGDESPDAADVDDDSSRRGSGEGDTEPATVVGDSHGFSLAPSVLLGEFTARIRAERESAERSLRSNLAQLREARRALTRRESGLGQLAWLMGGLATMLMTVLVIALGVPRWIRMTEWSVATRTSLGVLMAAAALGTAIGTGVAVGAFRSTEERRNLTAAKLMAIAWIGAVGIGLAWSDRLRGTTRDLLPPELVFFVTVLLCLLVVARAAVDLDTAGGRGAARLIGSIALGYVALSVIGGVEREGGWYYDLTTSERAYLIFFTVGILVIAMAIVLALIARRRVSERLRLRDAAARLRWLVDTSRGTARQVSSLTAAENQAIGTATALVRLFRLPFGHLRGILDDRPVAPNEYCSAKKVQIHRFDLDPRAQQLLTARIRHQLGGVGWLVRQYENAVRAFRPELAMLHGADPEDLSSVRPEEDPSAPRYWGSLDLPRGVRWDFVRLLYSGRLDAALQAPLGELATDELLSGYIDRSGGRIDGSPSSIGEFAAPLALKRPPPLPFYLFVDGDLPTATDDRVHLRSRLYWPTNAVRLPSGTVHNSIVTTRIHDAGSKGIVIPFVRVDWSETMALSQLPLVPHLEGEPGSSEEVGDRPPM